MGIQHVESRPARRQHLGSLGRALGTGCLCAVALAGALGTGCGQSGPTFEVRELSLDLLSGEATWEQVAAHPGQAPYVGELCPSLDPEVDGADLLSLLMPPPAEVRIRVPEEFGQLQLMVAAGVSFDSHRSLPDDELYLELGFEVWVEGDLAFTHSELLERIPMPKGRPWGRPANSKGIDVSGGDELRLITTCKNAEGEHVLPEVAFEAGFARLRLVRPFQVESSSATKKRPNVILILQDTQRADRLGAYGYGRPTSPHLDALAERGTTLLEAHATSSWTWPSTTSVLTGLDPTEHGVLDENSCYLDTSLASLPLIFQREGMRTAGFSGSRLIQPGKNYDTGFQHFEGQRGKFWKSDGLMPRAISWVREHKDERFFLYLHLVDTHAPHTPDDESLELLTSGAPEGWSPDLFQKYTQLVSRATLGNQPTDNLDAVVSPEMRLWMSELYDACVRTGDKQVGALLQALKDLGLEENTVIAFTSDHGEEFFEHGRLEHGHGLHRELVRVPVILAGPGVAAGLRLDTPVSNRHLAPTLARLAGAELDTAGDGLDLTQLGEDSDRAVLFGTEHGLWRFPRRAPQHGMISDGWVLHWAPEGFPSGQSAVRGEDGRLGPGPGDWRLFERSDDLNEMRDRAAEEPELGRAMLQQLSERLKVLKARRTSKALAAGNSTLNTLDAIGYLGDDGAEQQENQDPAGTDSVEPGPNR